MEYWRNKGKYQKALDEMTKLIPSMGEYDTATSEQEDHEFNVLSPLVEKLCEDNNGVTELCDVVVEWSYEKKFGKNPDIKKQKNIDKKLKEQKLENEILNNTGIVF